MHVSSDASKVSAAFIAYQILPSGEISYIGCTSRLFTTAERRFTSFRLESVALLSGLAAFDYIMRFAKHIYAVVDARALIFLRLSKLSSGYSFRVAEALSYYPLTIHHLKTRGTSNWLADLVSRSVELKDVETTSSLTEKEAQELLELVTLPSDYVIDQKTLNGYLTDTGGQTNRPAKKNYKSSTATVTENNKKPTMMPTKPQRIPRTVRNHPFYKNQRRHLSRNKVDFTKPQSDQRSTDHTKNNQEQKKTISEEQLTETQRKDTRLQIMTRTTIDTIYEEDETNDIPNAHTPLPLGQFTEDDIPEQHLNAIFKLIISNDYELNTAKLLIQRDDNNDTTTNKAENKNATPNTKQANDITTNKIIENTDKVKDNNNIIETLILNARVYKDGHISLQTLLEEQRNDLLINNIRQTNPMPKQFFDRKGFLLAKVGNDERIVIPETLFKQLSYQYHHSLLGLHQTPDTMYKRISRAFYHPQLKNRLQQIYDSCLVCRSERNRKSKLQTFGEKTIPTQPRQIWQFDVCCGLPSGQCKFIFVFTCVTTCFTILVPSPTREAHRIKDAFENHIVKPF